MRLNIQAVGARVDQHYDRPWAGGETRSSRLVVIGLHDIDQSAITAEIQALV
jgi:cobalamin biosynthesis protein CobW